MPRSYSTGDLKTFGNQAFRDCLRCRGGLAISFHLCPDYRSFNEQHEFVNELIDAFDMGKFRGLFDKGCQPLLVLNGQYKFYCSAIGGFSSSIDKAAPPEV